MKREGNMQNGNGNLQNENRNRIFYVEMETKTTMFSDGTHVEMELSVFVNIEFPFLLWAYGCFVAQPPNNTQ